jgi:hypothetical protein
VAGAFSVAFFLRKTHSYVLVFFFVCVGGERAKELGAGIMADPSGFGKKGGSATKESTGQE